MRVPDTLIFFYVFLVTALVNNNIFLYFCDMYKTISQDNAVSEKYNGYKLCYIDEIEKTYSDWSPETLKYMETEDYRRWNEECERIRRETPPGQAIPWRDNPNLRLQDYPNPEYIKGKQEYHAYFTPIELKDQWGDDWDDAPYEHNAGRPYDDDYVNDKRVEHEILVLPFFFSRYHALGGVKLPEDFSYSGNSPFCVRDINDGAVAWLFAESQKGKEGGGIAVHAGISPREFIEKVETINKTYPYIPEEDEEDD